MVQIFDSRTNERLWADLVLLLPNFEGCQLQIDIRIEENVLTHLYYIDEIDRENSVIYVTPQKSYLNDQQVDNRGVRNE